MSKAIADLLQIFKSSVSAVLPEKLIRNTVKYNSSDELLSINNKNYNLRNRNVYLVGTGKAVQSMAKEIETILGTKIKQGIVSVPVGSLGGNNSSGTVLYHEGAKNNLPDVDAQETAKKVKNLVNKLTHNDLLLVLISGGGSALLPLPKEPISLEDKMQLIKSLANSGADITELNTVRKKISELKGGKLAIMAEPANVVSLILSDIVGDPLDLIASGPTTENKDHPNAAVDIINKYNLYNEIPGSIKTVLKDNTQNKEFVKNKVTNNIIGSNTLSTNAAATESRALNYIPIILSNTVSGNVKYIAHKYVKLTKLFCSYIQETINEDELKTRLMSLDIQGIHKECLDDIDDMDFKNKNVCLVLGGEITVEVKGSGKGGRNQQLALEYSNYIHKTKGEYENFDIYILSAGTDGIDGPTDAAGAIGYLDLVSDAKNKNIDVQKYINNNDSYNFYKLFNDNLHIITGHTNTNVMDIYIILIRKKL